MTSDDKSFMNGFAVAVVALATGHGADSLAADLIFNCGFHLADFKHCIAHDRAVIRRLFRDDHKLRTLRKAKR